MHQRQPVDRSIWRQQVDRAPVGECVAPPTAQHAPSSSRCPARLASKRLVLVRKASGGRCLELGLVRRDGLQAGRQLRPEQTERVHPVTLGLVGQRVRAEEDDQDTPDVVSGPQRHGYRDRRLRARRRGGPPVGLVRRTGARPRRSPPRANVRPARASPRRDGAARTGEQGTPLVGRVESSARAPSTTYNAAASPSTRRGDPLGEPASRVDGVDDRAGRDGQVVDPLEAACRCRGVGRVAAQQLSLELHFVGIAMHQREPVDRPLRRQQVDRAPIGELWNPLFCQLPNAFRECGLKVQCVSRASDWWSCENSGCGRLGDALVRRGGLKAGSQ